jgi:hypothetical protein
MGLKVAIAKTKAKAAFQRQRGATHSFLMMTDFYQTTVALSSVCSIFVLFFQTS